jgi:hypothetical protein
MDPKVQNKTIDNKPMLQISVYYKPFWKPRDFVCGRRRNLFFTEKKSSPPAYYQIFVTNRPYRESICTVIDIILIGDYYVFVI